MRALWVSLCVTLLIAFVEAQRNINVLNPTVSLDKRPRLPTWRRLPEERRKLSIFPKNNKKFVVTERTTLKNEATTPVIATKKPLMRKLIIKDKTAKDTVIYPPRKPLMETKRFNELTTSTPKRDNNKNFKAKEEEAIAEESTIKTAITSMRTDNSVNTFKLNRGNLIQVLDSINKATVTSAKISEHANKDPNKQETKVVQNDDALQVNWLDKTVEESVTEKSAFIAVTNIEEQVDKTTEKFFFNKQEDKMIQNNASPNTGTHEKGSVEYEYEEIYYDNSEANLTSATVNEQFSTSTEKVFLSELVHDVGQNNDLLTINLLDNVSDKSVTNESDLNVSVATPAQIRNKEEIETTIHTFTEEPVSFDKPFEGRSLDSNDMEIHDQSDHLFLDLSNKHTSEKTEDSSKFENLETLMKAIEKDTWSDSDNKPSLNSNVVRPLAVKVQDSNEKTVKTQSQEFGERSDNYYEVTRVINRKNETKMSTENNIDAAVTEVTEKNGAENIETKADYRNTEINKSDMNIDIIYNSEDSHEVITSKLTSPDIKEFTESLQHSKLDLNTFEEYTDKSDTMSLVYDKTTIGSDSYDSLTEATIEITFDNLKIPSLEEISNETSIIKPVIIDESSNDRVAEVLKKTEDGNTNNFSEIDNFNIKQNTNNDKSAIIDYLHNLEEVIQDKATVGDGSEVAVDKKPLVNLDINIIEEYSDKPDINTTEVEGSIQESYSNAISLTESPIEIIFDSQEAPVSQKKPFETTFNIYLDKIIDNFEIDQLNVTDEVLTTAHEPVLENSLEVEDGNINIICAIENLSNGQNLKENNTNDAIENDLTNLDVVVNNVVHDINEYAIDGTQFLNEHANIVDEYSVKPDGVTIKIDETINTNEADIEGGQVTDAPTGIIFYDNEPLSADETLTTTKYNTKDSVTDNNVAIDGTEFFNHHEDDSNKSNTVTVVTQETHNGHVTDALKTITFNDPELPNTDRSETKQLDLLIYKVGAAATEVTPRVEDGNTKTVIENLVIKHYVDDKTNSPIFADIINNESNNLDNNKVTARGPQLVNVHINKVKENSDKHKTVTIIFEGTTQKTYLNGENIDDGLDILFDDFEPHDRNKLLPIRSLNQETNEPVSEQSSLSDVVISNDTTTDKSVLRDEDISNEWIVINSSPSDEMTTNKPIVLKSNYYKSVAVSNESNKADEDISSETIGDNSLDLSDDISNESFIFVSFSSQTNEEMSGEIMIAEADQSKNLTDEISNESYVLNVSSSSLVTNEGLSRENMPNKSDNITDEISNESYFLNSSSISFKINDEKISDEKMVDKSSNSKGETSNELHHLNENSSSLVINEEISDEINANKSENLTEETSNESYVLNDSSSSLVTNEEISGERNADKSENLTEETSNESHVLNESSSSLVTNEEISGETNTDKPENLTEETSNESHVLNESSSSLVTNEDISGERNADKSENFTEETSNESHVLNESSSSLVTNEEISGETNADKPENLTEETSNESHVLNESSSSLVTNEEISDEKIADKSENFTEETLNEPHVLNESSSSLILNGEISDELSGDKSENLTHEMSNDSPVIVTGTSSTDLTGEELFDISEQPNNETNEDVSTEPAIDIRHSSTKLTSNEIIIKRRKRSNNVIEEENLATTLSGFKYTGHGTRLGHDLRFKNINV